MQIQFHEQFKFNPYIVCAAFPPGSLMQYFSEAQRLLIQSHQRLCEKLMLRKRSLIRAHQSTCEMTDLPRGLWESHGPVPTAFCPGLTPASDVCVVWGIYAGEPWEVLKLWCGASLTHCLSVKIAESDNSRRLVELLRDLLDVCSKDTNHGSQHTWPRRR